MANARIREALTAGTNLKEKGTPTPDGVLTVTPDTPEVAEWRSKSVLDCVATTSSYLDEDDFDGKKPNELFGKFTWKIENFSEISKRELRSNQFDVGEYKWYILVYPQGCDVCNHLSLFLCVADYDKLLPGWSHFAQFTIAVVNKDPKKSKYSDTLHRFCKKEHDWGWKKFMELSKVLDGFTVADTLVIKAQVQVILDKPGRPFRCLDPQYRRELVRVYLTNVESICRRFCEEKRAKLAWLKEEAPAFKAWWESLPAEKQRKHTTEKGEGILKGIVKQFFNEKEVTSTLVMDALYCGCKQLEEYSRVWMEGKATEGSPSVVIRADRKTLSFGADVVEVAERAAQDFIPAYRDDKALLGSDGLALRTGQDADGEFRRDSVERDEKRLAELGKRTVEMYAIAHIFSEKLEIAYRHDQALKRQELLIAEEEEAGRLQDQRAQAKQAADKEKRAKKKERKKAKKEAEKAKKDAEDAERRAVEEARRLAMEKKQAEANERKRQEEVAAQALLQQQVLQQKQRQAEKAAAAAASSRQQADADSVGRSPRRPSQHARQLSKSQLDMASDMAASQQPVASSSAAYDGPSTRGIQSDTSSPTALSQADDSASSLDSSASETSSMDSSKLFAPVQPPAGMKIPVGGAALNSPTTTTRGLGSLVATSNGPSRGTQADGLPIIDLRRQREAEEELGALRKRVRQLEQLVDDKDKQLQDRHAEIYALRAQLSELQPTELAEFIKEAAAAKVSGSGAVSSSAAVSGGTSSGPSSAPGGGGAGAAGDSSHSGSCPSSTNGSLDKELGAPLLAAVAAADKGGLPNGASYPRAWSSAPPDGPVSPTRSLDAPAPSMVPASSAPLTAAASHDGVRDVPGGRANDTPTATSGTVMHALGSSSSGPGRRPGHSHGHGSPVAPPGSPAPAGPPPPPPSSGGYDSAALHQAQPPISRPQGGPGSGMPPATAATSRLTAPGGSRMAPDTAAPVSTAAGQSGRNSQAHSNSSSDHIKPPHHVASDPGVSGPPPPHASHQRAASVSSAHPASPQVGGAPPPAASSAAPGDLSLGAGATMLRTSSAGLPSSAASHPSLEQSHSDRSHQSGQQASYGGGLQQGVRHGNAGVHVPMKSGPFLTPTSSGTSVAQNGIAGVLHTTTAVHEPLPSYRNAAAGVMGGGSHGMTGHGPSHGNMVNVSNAAGVLSMGSSKHLGDGAGNGNGVRMGRAPTNDNPFASFAAQMPQQSRPMAFGPMPPKGQGHPQQRSSYSPLGQGPDNTGLEEFAHMNLIDDLLTE